MIGKVILTGGPKCPTCGKVFTAIPPLRPNVKDRAFYGGRVNFFKEVTCECTAKYDLCIEKKFNHYKENEELNVINMIVLKPGISKEEVAKLRQKEFEEKAEAAALEAVSQAVQQAAENDERFPHLAERQEIKKQTILATIIDKDEKIKTLTLMTTKELQTMCKRRKLKFNKRDNKTQLAETLLAYDPALVVANPEG